MYEDPSKSNMTQWLIDLSPYLLGVVAIAVFFFLKLS